MDVCNELGRCTALGRTILNLKDIGQRVELSEENNLSRPSETLTHYQDIL